MKILLKLEELAMFLFAVVLLTVLSEPVKWWWYLLLIIAPDISMLGYLVNNKIGAYCYNLFHHKGVAILFILVGFVLSFSGHNNLFPADDENVTNYVTIWGIIMFGHSSMDRFFGFGLKTEEGFKFTHLGKIGKEKDENI